MPILILVLFFSGRSAAQHQDSNGSSIRDVLVRLEAARSGGDWNGYHSDFIGLIRRTVSGENERAAKSNGILKELKALKKSANRHSEFDYILYCLQQYPLDIAESEFLSRMLKMGLTDLAANPEMERRIRLYYSLAMPFDYANWRKQNGFYQEAIDTMERVKNRLLHLTEEETWNPYSRNFLLHCYNIMGGIYADLGMFPIAISYNDLYLEMIKSDQNPWGKVLALGRKGDYLLSLGDTLQSLQILEEAVKISTEEYPNILENETAIKNGRSSNYVRYTSRLKSAYRDLANVCIATGRMERADRLLEYVESIPLLSREDSIYHAIHRADYFARSGDLRRAIQVMTPVLSTVLDPKHQKAKQLAIVDDQSLRLLMVAGLKLAGLQMEGKDFKSASQTLDRLELELQKLSRDLRLDWIQLGIERVRLDLRRHSHQPFQVDLNITLQKVIQTQSLILDYQATTTDDASKLALNRSGRELFGLALALAAVMPSGLVQDELAIQHAEAGRTVLLDQALRFQRADRFLEIPDSIRKVLVQLNALIGRYELNQSLGHSLSQQDQSRLTTLKEDKRQLMLYVKKEFPKSYRHSMVRHLPNIDMLRKHLPKDAAVLSLSLHDTLVFAQLITGTETVLHQISVPSDFRKIIQNFLNDLKASRNEDLSVPVSQSYVQKARWFYILLFSPFEDMLPKRLLIVPDGPLAFLPFDALLTEDVNRNATWSSLPYQIHKRALSVHFSVGTWIEEEQKELPAFEQEWMGFAPDFPVPLASRTVEGVERDILIKLLYNKKEVERVGAILNGSSFLGQDASLSAFIESAGKSSILHLSTHAKANDLRGDLCYIAFANSNVGDASDPGDTLRAAEIYGLRIPAELLILSACESGVGEVKDGEGMIGLHHAFMHVGVRSILSTLWMVDDRSMADLIVFFAKKLSEGFPKDVALQLAKRQFLDEHPSRTHPFYWSAPTVQGSLQPIRNTNYVWYWVGGLILLVSLFLGYRISQSQKN